MSQIRVSRWISLYLYWKDKKKTKFFERTKGYFINWSFFVKIIVDFFRLILLLIFRMFDDDHYHWRVYLLHLKMLRMSIDLLLVLQLKHVLVNWQLSFEYLLFSLEKQRISIIKVHRTNLDRVE